MAYQAASKQPRLDLSPHAPNARSESGLRHMLSGKALSRGKEVKSLFVSPFSLHTLRFVWEVPTIKLGTQEPRCPLPSGRPE